MVGQLLNKCIRVIWKSAISAHLLGKICFFNENKVWKRHRLKILIPINPCQARCSEWQWNDFIVLCTSRFYDCIYNSDCDLFVFSSFWCFFAIQSFWVEEKHFGESVSLGTFPAHIRLHPASGRPLSSFFPAPIPPYSACIMPPSAHIRPPYRHYHHFLIQQFVETYVSSWRSSDIPPRNCIPTK